MSKKIPRLLAVFLIGATGVTSQILLARELITVFMGNELIYGMVIMLWLVLYAAGSAILGRFSDRIKNKTGFFVLTQFLAMILLPCQIYLSRTIKILWGINQGSIIGLPDISLISIIILAPLALLLGFQFALGSQMLSEEFQKRAIGLAYMFEASGWVFLGGSLYFLLNFIRPFQIAAVLILLLAFSANLLLKKTVGVLFFILAFLVLLYSPFIESSSARLSFKGFDLIFEADSPYGRISLIRDKGSMVFYENGGLLFSTADRLGCEELIHLSFLQHKNPRRILLIGGGFGGALDEIAKYEGADTDYLELDPKVIELSKIFLPGRAENPNLNIFAQDGISFLNLTKSIYDLIIVNLPNPETALINRFYTFEFFLKCRSHLKPNGTLALKLSTSETFYGKELRLLNASIYKTLSGVFPNIIVIPGNYNYFYASGAPLTYNREVLINRWRGRDIRTSYFRDDSLYILLDPKRINFTLNSVKPGPDTRLNLELSPISYFLTTLLWASYFSSLAKNIFYFLMDLDWTSVLVFIALFLIILRLLTFRFKLITPPLIILFLGFAGMSTSLLIIFTFQLLYGYLYHSIVLLTAAYMSGLVAGSFLINFNYDKVKRPALTLRIMILCFAIFLFLLLKYITVIYLPLAAFFAALPLGMAFPLAAKIYEREKIGYGALAGILFGADLLGGGLAAVLTSLFLVPVFGVYKTLALQILLALGAFILL